MHVQKLIRIQHHQPICAVDIMALADLGIARVLRDLARFHLIGHMRDKSRIGQARKQAVGAIAAII